mmetsp:Transcript_35141/g.74853  ORF Transcript_35141/g.74853 Transcript_35141/m.74853 type:complete len:237 (+) Transcript_35141:531-1241(+)
MAPRPWTPRHRAVQRLLPPRWAVAGLSMPRRLQLPLPRHCCRPRLHRRLRVSPQQPACSGLALESRGSRTIALTPAAPVVLLPNPGRRLLLRREALWRGCRARATATSSRPCRASAMEARCRATAMSSQPCRASAMPGNRSRCRACRASNPPRRGRCRQRRRSSTALQRSRPASPTLGQEGWTCPLPAWIAQVRLAQALVLSAVGGLRARCCPLRRWLRRSCRRHSLQAARRRRHP